MNRSGVGPTAHEPDAAPAHSDRDAIEPAAMESVNRARPSEMGAASEAFGDGALAEAAGWDKARARPHLLMGEPSSLTSHCNSPHSFV